MLAPRLSEAVAGHLSKLVAANDNHKYCRAKNDNDADRLKIVTQGAATVASAYDGLSRYLKQNVGATKMRYSWCGVAICQQRNGSDTAEKRFYSEVEYVHSGSKKYLTLTDHLGSVRDVIDITGTPTLVAAFDYRPSGAVARSWGTVTTGYTYAGEAGGGLAVLKRHPATHRAFEVAWVLLTASTAPCAPWVPALTAAAQ